MLRERPRASLHDLQRLLARARTSAALGGGPSVAVDDTSLRPAKLNEVVVRVKMARGAGVALLAVGAAFLADSHARADSVAVKLDPAPGPAAELPPFRPGAPKAWEDPGAGLWSRTANFAIAASGNLQQDLPLFSWSPPGVGAPIDVRLVQNSADAQLDGPLGRSVRLAVAAKLTVGVDAVSIEEPDGTVRVFTRQGASFASEVFDHDRLEASGDGYVLRLPYGFTRVFSRGHGEAYLETSGRDRVGDATTFTYDAADRLVEVKDSAGRAATFHVAGNVYDAIVDPEGRVFSLRYASGFLIQIAGPALASGQAPTLNFYWDGPTRQLRGRSSWASGPGAIFAYDDQNRVTAYRAWGDEGTGQITYAPNTVTLTTPVSVTSWRYEQGALVEQTDAQGRRTRIARDARHRIVALTDTLDKVTRYTYDDADNPVTEQDPAGAVVRRAYDARHRVTATTDPFGQTTVRTYDDLDDVTSVTNALGEHETYSFDARGNLLAAIDFAGKTRFTATYNALGHPLTQTDARGRTTATTYDARGSWLTARASDGTVTSRTVSLLGRTLTTTNALGETTTVTYDALGRATSTTDPTNGRVSVTRDVEGRVVAFGDATGPTAQTATFTWSPERFVASNTVNGRPVRVAAPVSQ